MKTIDEMWAWISDDGEDEGLIGMFTRDGVPTPLIGAETRSCDLCEETALYDARLTLGSWANLCADHFHEVFDA